MVQTEVSGAVRAPGDRSLVRLRDLVLKGNLIGAEAFDEVCVGNPTLGVMGLVGELRRLELLTAAQASRLGEQLRLELFALADGLRERLVAKGLITVQEGREAEKSYQAGAWQQISFGHQLVSSGVLTAPQVEAAAPGAGLASRFDRFRRLPAWLFGLGQWIQTQFREHRARSLGASLALMAGLVTLGGLGWALRPDILQIEPECVMDGSGHGTCTFTNSTTHPAQGQCGFIAASCEGSPGRESSTICGGELTAHGSHRVGFDVARFDQITPSRSDWRDACSFIWARKTEN